jgi:hypothetical protein
VNRLQHAVVGVWVLWIGISVLFPNWQQAAERELDYRKELGRHFVLTPPAPIAVPCYFVECITAPPSYFHVLLDRNTRYQELLCATALMILAVVIFRSASSPIRRHWMLVAVATWIALSLPVPIAPYFPLGVWVGYMPAALLHPDHDHISVLIGFPFFFAVYGVPTYVAVRAAVWANTSLKGRTLARHWR